MVSKLFLSKFPSLPIIHQSTDKMHTPYSILRFEGHQGFVNTVAFSPDGKYIASGSCDYTVRLWNVETGEAAFQPFEGHKDDIFSVVFSPDGEYIASGSKDHTIRLWNIKTGKITVKPFEGNIVECPTSVSFTSDGKHIISVAQKHITYLWNVESGEMVSKPLAGHDFEDFRIDSAAISSNGIYIALQATCSVGGNSKALLQLWNVETGKVTLSLSRPSHSTFLFSISFSPDGKFIVSSNNCIIELWNIETGELALKPFKGHQDIVCSAMFSPDGRYIVSGSFDCTVRVWDVQTGEEALEPFEGHTSVVPSTSFSPDGKYIVSGSDDCTIRLWKFETNKVGSRPIEWHTGPINSVSFSPDGKYIASGSDDYTVRLWNVGTGRAALKPFEGHTSKVTSLSFSRNGKYIASGSFNMIRLWNVKTGELEVEFAPFEGYGGQVTSVSFFPDGKHIASCSLSDTVVHLWNIKTISQTFSGRECGMPKGSFSPDGKYIAAGFSDGTVQLRSIETGELEAAFKPLFGVPEAEDEDLNMVRYITFSADGKYIVIFSYNNEIQLCQWKDETGGVALLSQGDLTRGITGTAAISPDNKYMIVGSYGTIQFCTIETDPPDSLALESPFGEYRGWVNSVSFSPDGKYIASGSTDHTIRIYHNNLVDRTYHDSGVRPAQTTFLHQYPIGSVVTGLTRSDEGWLQYPSGELLLWVRPELHLGLYFPGIVHVIGADSIKIELSKFVHGTEWSKCHEERCDLRSYH